MHEYEEAVSMWGLDVPAVDPRTALRHFSVACLGFLAFGMTAYYALVPAMPAIRREYPYGGLVTELGGIEENKVCRLPNCIH
jgi:NADH dehydrogenase (ubiquinone) 1 beta subcomplex subunit 8